AILVAAGLAIIHFPETPTAPPTMRFQVAPPAKATFVDYPTISPDGRRLALEATVDGKTFLLVPPLDSLAAPPLARTQRVGQAHPFWSPDSRLLGFFAQGKLKKVDLSGGAPQVLCNVAPPPRGGSWSPNGTILFGGGTREPLYRVSADGGAPVPVTTLEPGTE